MVKNLPAKQETWVQSLSRKELLEKEMAIHSSILARKIPWTEESRLPNRIIPFTYLTLSPTPLPLIITSFHSVSVSLFIFYFLDSTEK